MRPALIHRTAMINFEKEEFIMASIVQRNKSFSVVYTTYTEGRKKQKWETYHSYEAALQRKEQIELIQAKQKENLQSHAETLADLLWGYVAL